MVTEKQFNLIKKDLKKGIKQYIISEKRKVSREQLLKIKRAHDYTEYSREKRPPFTQVQIPFDVPGNEDLYKLLIEIRDSVEELHARQGV